MTVEPADNWQQLELLERGELRGKRARALVARLPRAIAERELRVIEAELGWDPADLVVEEVAAARGPGNVILIELESEHITEVVAAFGSRGVAAEAVARDAVEQTRHYLNSATPVGEHLADQLLIPFALAGGGTFRTVGMSSHTMTNLEVIKTFLDLEIETVQSAPANWLVKLRR